jgi:hypothetical protein
MSDVTTATTPTWPLPQPAENEPQRLHGMLDDEIDDAVAVFLQRR